MEKQKDEIDRTVDEINKLILSAPGVSDEKKLQMIDSIDEINKRGRREGIPYIGSQRIYKDKNDDLAIETNYGFDSMTIHTFKNGSDEPEMKTRVDALIYSLELAKTGELIFENKEMANFIHYSKPENKAHLDEILATVKESSDRKLSNKQTQRSKLTYS